MSEPKYIMWVLNKLSPKDSSFEHQKGMFNLMFLNASKEKSIPNSTGLDKPNFLA